MKIRLLSDRVDHGWYQPAGSVIELERGDALRMIESGSAELVSNRTDNKIEAAVEAPAETAALTYKPQHRKRRP